jgi:tRNA-2-methylthio-N6-dimethylallyladenosine synthase
VITGFCGETEEQHQDTVSLLKEVKYDFSYMFMYSERPKTLAERKYKDDVPEEIKKRRLQEVVALQQEHSAYHTNKAIGKTFKVLVEGVSKKNKEELFGRNTQNTVVVFPKGNIKKGQYVNVLVERCTVTTLIGKVV